MGMIKGHEFNKKEMRQKVNRKQRRKEKQHDQAVFIKARKKAVKQSAKKSATKKPKKDKLANLRELNDENLAEILSEYTKDGE